jgi:predicted NAD/FAD-dependent oxidoreductase
MCIFIFLMVDKKNKLAACGDWLIQGRVESAFESANAMADEILAEF